MLEFHCEIGQHYTETLHFVLSLSDGTSYFVDEAGQMKDVRSLYKYEENIWKKWGFRFEYGKKSYLIEVVDEDPKIDFITASVIELGECVGSYGFKKLASRAN